MTNHNITPYTEYLQDKNLSSNTIRLYLNVLDKFTKKFSTENLKDYFRTNLKNYQDKYDAKSIARITLDEVYGRSRPYNKEK